MIRTVSGFQRITAMLAYPNYVDLIFAISFIFSLDFPIVDRARRIVRWTGVLPCQADGRYSMFLRLKWGG